MNEYGWILDGQIFEWINGTTSNVVFDAVLPIIRNKFTWIPFYVFLVGALFYQFRWRALPYIGFLILTVGLADTVSSKIIKPAVKRVRPCNRPADNSTLKVIARIPCGSGFSFPSSHASNHFAIAFFLIASGWVVLRLWVSLLILWAALIGYSQIYVGVHFPVDVLVGSVLGMAIGFLFAKLWRVANVKYNIWN